MRQFRPQWRWSRAVCVAALIAGTAFLYTRQLGSVPPYLSIEETSHARHALRLAQTGRDAEGHLIPLFFRESGNGTLREPVWLYATAAWLTVTRFSEAVIRLTSAIAGVLNVVLMFLVAREVFGRVRPSLVAAAFLAVAPAHFEIGR